MLLLVMVVVAADVFCVAVVGVCAVAVDVVVGVIVVDGVVRGVVVVACRLWCCCC